MSANVIELAPRRAARPAASKEYLSPSQASTYLQCGAKHWFRYSMGLPDPAGGGAVRGKAVHQVVEYALAAKMAKVALGPADLADAWDRAWDIAAENAEFHAYDDIEGLKASGALMTHKYLREVAPTIEPAALEAPFAGEIAGVRVRGVADIVTVDGTVIDIKTSSRKPSGLSADHALQLATYAALAPGATGATQIHTLVSTRDPQLIQIEHTPGAAGRRLVERLYPLVAEGIAGGLYVPNRNGPLCSRRYCAFADACEKEFGGVVE